MAWSLGLQSLWPAGAEKAFCLGIQRRLIRRSWRRASGFWADFVIIWILMELWATSVFLLETFQGLFTTSRKIYCSLFLDASLHGSSIFEPYNSFNPPQKKLASLRIILAPKPLIGGDGDTGVRARWLRLAGYISYTRPSIECCNFKLLKRDLSYKPKRHQDCQPAQQVGRSMHILPALGNCPSPHPEKCTVSLGFRGWPTLC